MKLTGTVEDKVFHEGDILSFANGRQIGIIGARDLTFAATYSLEVVIVRDHDLGTATIGCL